MGEGGNEEDNGPSECLGEHVLRMCGGWGSKMHTTCRRARRNAIVRYSKRKRKRKSITVISEASKVAGAPLCMTPNHAAVELLFRLRLPQKKRRDTAR